MKNCLVPVLFAVSIALTGCGSQTEAPSDSHEGHDDHAHAHPSEGPHHGSLIELGNEEYHAELVHDEATNSVTIYVLDSSAKKSVPIDATELLVNLSHDGEAEQFSLSADPDEGDPAGKSSRFVSTDTELAEDLDHEGAEAVLVLTIEGKQYRGEIHHDHDDEDHDDDHDH